MANRFSTGKRARIIGCLVEGMSIRATARITGAAKNTVSKLLFDLGTTCREYQDKTLRNLPCKRIQCDEVWSFRYAQQKNVPDNLEAMFGDSDVWTWTAICADTKIIPCWLVANRSGEAAKVFIDDLASRLSNSIQLITDGHKVRLNAIESAFDADNGDAMRVKLYGSDESENTNEKRYNSSECKEDHPIKIIDKKNISTSYIERQNLTMRMNMRRFTRPTNAFSKKVKNLEAAISLHFMYYNFSHIHQTLHITPAMEAGVSDHVWSFEDIAGLLDSN